MEKYKSTALVRPNPQEIGERLNSWKEIATFLNREVRTVRRWETYESLPVHRHIHKIRGSVYAFKAEVDAWWTNRRAQPRTSAIVLAVLPFETINRQGKKESLGHGLPAEIATQLVRLDLDKLRVTDCAVVANQTASSRVDKHAEPPGSTHVVGGTIRSQHNSTVITAYLLRASDRTYVWAESYGETKSDVIVNQTDVARHIAQSIAAKLLPTENVTHSRMRADHSAVQRACSEGRSSWNRRTAEGLVKAISCFDQAIQQDPTYAPAHAGLADSYLQLGFYGILPAVPAMKKAKSAALKAVELDDSSGEAHASLADVMKYFDWNLTGAEREYQRAIELDPCYPTAHHWYGDYLAMMGRFDEAHEKGQHALDLDPVSPIINTWVGMQLYLGGLYGEAVEQLRKTRAMHPNYALARWALGLVYDQQHKFKDAVVEKQKAVILSGESPWMVAALGCSYAASGKRDEAKNILNRLVGPAHRTSSISYEIATIYAALYDNDSSLQWLQRAVTDHSAWVPFMKVEPRLRYLRADNRFQRLANGFASIPA
jgi:TolB-like protein/tetratricopeptide (TPR) repeat protein